MLPHGHPLTTATTESGFTLTGNHILPPVDFDQAALERDRIMPLREVIPFTEGRALGWKLAEHVSAAKARQWPGLKLFEFNGQSIAICGGGPSLGDTLYDLRALQKSGSKVMAINRTHDYLIGLPQTHKIPWIKPWAGILLEPLINASGYMRPAPGVRYYVGSQCHPATFNRFEKSEHYIWHAQSKMEMINELSPEERRLMVPSIGSTCGLRAVVMAYMIGFTDIHMFGFDSCYRTDDVMNGIRGADGAPKLHAYAKPETIHDSKELIVRGFADGERRYFGNTNMLSQADEFKQFLMWRADRLACGGMDPHRITVHGYGVIPDIAREFGIHADNLKPERIAA